MGRITAYITYITIYAYVCSKTCLVTVLICSIFAWEKLHYRFSASAVFPGQNRTNYHSSKTCFAFITHLLSAQTTKLWKMLMNNKFKAQSLNRKSYRKFTLSWFSVTCFKHVGLLWPISALDRKQVRGYAQWLLWRNPPLRHTVMATIFCGHHIPMYSFQWK